MPVAVKLGDDKLVNQLRVLDALAGTCSASAAASRALKDIIQDENKFLTQNASLDKTLQELSVQIHFLNAMIQTQTRHLRWDTCFLPSSGSSAHLSVLDGAMLPQCILVHQLNLSKELQGCFQELLMRQLLAAESAARAACGPDWEHAKDYILDFPNLVWCLVNNPM